jgi:hypothetical protein
MSSRHAARSALAQARRQSDVVTTAQMAAHGVLASWVSYQVRTGRWQRLHQGVVVTHSGPISWRSRAWAALLYAGAGAALSHHAAARLWEFTPREPVTMDVTVPAHRRVRPTAGVRVHVRRRMPDTVGGLRATSRPETAVDLVAAAKDVDDAVGWLARAVRAGARPEAVLAAARSRTRFRHRGLLIDLLDEGELTIESPMEHRYVRDVERVHGLPRGTSQARHRVGGRWIRADRWYAAAGVRVELDGRIAHSGARVDADVWRDNAVALERSELTLRYRWWHVAATPCTTATQVAAALRGRGWPGHPRACGPTCSFRRAVAEGRPLA